MEKRYNYTRAKEVNTGFRLDWTLIFTFLGMMLFSLIAIYSTSYLQYEHGSLRATLLQAAWFAVGSVLAIILMQIDRETLFRLAPLGYSLGILLLILVLIFYDRSIFLSSGAKSWLRIGSFTFQPSEMMKFFYILMMSRLVFAYTTSCEQINYANLPLKNRMKIDRNFLLRLLLWSIPPFTLVLIQNDFGTMLVYMMILVGVIFVSGISWHIIIPSFLILSAVFLLLLFLVLYDRQLLLAIGFKNYQFSRIDSWLQPFSNTASESYQLSQSLKAIGSGKIFGKGLGQFEVYVPVRESDMIFATIGENFGFLGASSLLLLFFILLYTVIVRAFSTAHSFYVAFAAGTVAMFSFHIIENIGMSIGLLPLTGIPLPLISQGGSALVTCCMCLGVIASIKFQQNNKREYKSYLNLWINRLIDISRIEKLPFYPE